MTTKTTISLSPIKRSSYGCNSIKKRRLLIHRQQQQINIFYSIPRINFNYEKQSTTLLPDIVNDIIIEQQRKETIINIATILRKVGDQIDEQLQINNTSSSASSSIDHIFGQRTITFVYCLSQLLRFFL